MSAAYQVASDLSRFDSRPRVREALANDGTPLRVLPAPKTRTAAPARVSARGAMVFVCVMALMFFIVYAYMQMAEMDRMSREILNDISELQKEEAQLRKQKAGLIDLKEIERVAVEELGMVKPGKNQVIYIDLSGEDNAEVLGN